MYQIKIDYRTGDSFGSSETSDVLELGWKDLEIAKKNLRNIKGHYFLYKKLNVGTCGSKIDEQEECGKVSGNDWFVADKKWFSKTVKSVISQKKKYRDKYGSDDVIEVFDTYYAGNCINLITDLGTKMQISCFWCGYFETLRSSEIITKEEDEDLKIYF